jgi:hypothetical protein|tara:strand:- start:15 stop:422 length:408 start_codon:yes stop_codon:yes gene_type:complete
MPEKVRVKYKGEFININKSYIEGLKGYERRKQIKSIVEGKDRPKVKGFKSKRSGWAKKFEEKYDKKITDLDFISKNIIKREGINKILSKGKGAFYSAGSRPNQTAFSWAYARLGSVIMNGPARKVDQAIWNEYKV